MAFLGIDVGTSGTKALLLSAAGNVLATSEAPHHLLTPKPGWTEQRPEQWWSAAVAATHALLKKSRAQLTRDPVAAIGLSGQMHGAVFLDARGKVIRPALLWNDQRTAGQCAQIEAKAGGREKLVQRVANPALTGFQAPKILWLMQNEPAHFARCRQILLPKDYLRFRLTADFATDVSDASGTLLLDVAHRSWHAELIALLGIDPTLLPRVVESQHITGTLSTTAARTLGLDPGIPVVGGAGDQAAGAVGTGVVLPGRVSASIGTSGVIFATSNAPQTDPLGRVHTMCHAIPNSWCLFGCMLAAGGSFQFMRNLFFADQARKLKDPGQLYPRMIAEARKIPPGSDGLLFLPYLAGERCPHADPNVRGAFLGLSTRHSRAHLLRATLEGITFAMREQISIFRELHIPIRQVRASGGGARSEFWRQLQADMYHAPVVTINVAEGAALGAAILAAVGTGAYASVPQATNAIIQIKHQNQPSPKAAKFYDANYPRYAAGYPALQSLQA